jgi:ABC-type bacteriocin/lantibiotic exporter with double-glycine peptidase domain
VTLHALAALLLLASPSVALSGPLPAARISVDVPIVVQSPERCGQAALEMVLRHYDADASAIAETDRAYDPLLRGSLITDLAAAARRGGFDAVIGTLDSDSLVALLASGVPPIVLYQNGRGPLTVRHFGVVTGWDPERSAFTLNAGGKRPRVVRRSDLTKRWQTAGSQALIVRPRLP